MTTVQASAPPAGQLLPGTVPTVLVGGYFGSGKTTLVRRLLERSPGTPTAVAVSDVGGVSVDGEALAPAATRVLRLPDPAGCCTDVNALSRLAHRITTLAGTTRRLLVELRGHVDPGALTGHHAGGDGLLVCADVTRLEALTGRRHPDCRLVRAQLAAAGVIVLTRAGHAEAGQVVRARAMLAHDHPQATVLTEPEALAAALPAAHVPAEELLRDEGAEELRCAHRVWSVTSRALVDLAAIEDLLASLPETVVRVKGVVRTAALPARRLLVDRVAGRREIRDGGVWAEAGCLSRLVVVGPREGEGLDDVARLVRAAMPGP
jgi:G3E family GTPase